MYRALHEVFHRKFFVQPDVNGPEVILHYQGNQRELYKQLIDIFRANSSDGADVQEAFNFTTEYVRVLHDHSSPHVEHREGKPHLVSEIPILTNDTLQKLHENPDNFDLEQRYAIVELAAAIVCEITVPAVSAAAVGSIPARVLVEIASYNAWKAIDDREQTDVNAVVTSRGNLQQHISSIASDALTKIDELRTGYSDASAAIDADVANLAEKVVKAIEAADLANQKAASFESRIQEIADVADQLSTDIVTKYHVTEDTAKAGLDAIRTEANFDSLKIHWVDRARASNWAWRISGALLFVLLIVLPAFAIYENEAVIDFMKRLTGVAVAGTTVENAAGINPVSVTVATVSRLVIITIPLALYFWLIRLVVRFNMRSMLLTDDARQRATMLETYYRMIEQQAATTADRALVLQALMRPAPGHGADTIEPPNFSDVMDKATGKGQ